jgi:DNA-binding SARP family transcriptional activator/tetratricopeptide (TPR) repeat protein
VGQPISISAIETALWGEFIPNTAKATIRTYVHRLRRTLGGGDRAKGSPVVSATGSYRLAVPPDAVDVTRFRASVAHASQETEAAVAAEGLRAALGLWRGEPLDGIPLRPDADRNLFAEERAQLHHERACATEMLADLETGLGRYGAATELLGAAIRAEPLRQDLHEMLIDTLHRAGQDPEALVAYEDIRHRLRVERGVEPSPRLRQLHGAITGDDTDGARRQRPVDVSPVVPAQLPMPLPVFVGRGQQITALHSALPDAAGPAPRVVLIHGMPGVGKTTLAVRWAQQVAGRFPDGTLYVNLRGFEENVAVATSDVLAGFLDALGVRAERERDLGALYRSALADRRCLVVLDNAGDSEQVLPLLPGGQGNFTLITSRGNLPAVVATTGARTERLDVLTADEAHELVTARLGSDAVDAEPEAVHGIVGLCARLPLALAVVCARAAANPDLPLRALIDELREADGSLDGFAGTEPSVDLRTVLSWSYRKLADPAARLFRLLALRPGRDFTARLAASVADVPLRQARALLRELVSANLVTEYAPASYEQHDLLRVLATELLRDGHSPVDRDRAVRRLVDHYLQSAHSAMRQIDYHCDHCSCPEALSGVVPHSATSFADAYDWFAREHGSLRSTIGLAAAEGLDDHAWRIAWAMGDFVELTGDVNELDDLGAQARQAAQRAGSTEGLAYGHRLLARAAIFDGRLSDARADLDVAIASLDRLGDHRASGYAIRNLLSVLRLRGEHSEALEWAERAQALFGASDCVLGEAVILTNTVTRCHVVAGRFDDAITAASEGLALYQKAQPPADMGIADCHNVLGRLHQLIGRDDEAAHHHRQALALFSDSEATSIEAPLWVMRMRAETMVELVNVHRTTGNGGAADTVLRDVLALYHSILAVTPAVHDSEEAAEALVDAVAHLDRALAVSPGEPRWRSWAQAAEEKAVAAMYRLRRDIEFRDQLLVSVVYPSGRRGIF